MLDFQAQTLAYFHRFLISKKHFNNQESTNKQDEKQNGQEVEITLNKMPDWRTKFEYKSCNQKKTG